MDIAIGQNHEIAVCCPAIIELSGALNPFLGDRVRIYAQVCGDNIKKLAALNLLVEARADGRLEGVHTLVENSSGNMAMAIGLFAPLFGVRNVIAILRADIASGKLDPLRLSRIQCTFSTESRDQPNGIQMAREMGKLPGHLNLGQYDNEANPRAYEKWLAPHIWKETGGKLTVACVGLGTTGTVIGLSRYFKRVSSQCTIVGVMCAPGHAVPGVRSEEQLADVRLDWREAVDVIQKVETKDSFKKSRELWWDLRLMVGPSSGFALVGLLNFLAASKATGILDQFRNVDGEVRTIFVCPDLAYPYFDKYSTHLDPWDLE